MASYNTMVMPDSRLMLGISTPIPLQRGRRGGLLEEADARAAEVRADAARTVDRIRALVSVARLQVIETIRVVKIIEQRVLPVARAQVTAARADFAPGRTSFLAVVEGEKNLREVELSLNTALAELGKRRARLDRMLGRMPHGAESTEAK
jgi:outer membrane protein TolC